jgi:hypothetical protein
LSAGAVLAFATVAQAENSIIIAAFRVDDPSDPATAFDATVNIVLEDVPGVTSVLVSINGSPPELLEEDGPGNWNLEGSFGSFAELVEQADGVFTITIVGDQPSTSSFTLDTDPLVDGDFYATPDGLFPPHGATGVPADVVLSWNDPTGPETPDGIFLFVGTDDFEQEDNSYAGTMSITDTSWDPPMVLDEGENEFSIGYFDFADAALVSSITVQSGTIEWSTSPLAPDGWPDQTPLLVFGSQSYAFFIVGCAEDLNGDGVVNVIDLLALLGAWGQAGVPEDLDGSGTVDVGDLLMLLAAWGAC